MLSEIKYKRRFRILNIFWKHVEVEAQATNIAQGSSSVNVSGHHPSFLLGPHSRWIFISRTLQYTPITDEE